MKLENDPWGSFDAFISAAETEQFIGKNFHKFKEKWSKIYEKSKAKQEKKNLEWYENFFSSSWNWSALLLWPAWFGYRKMHKQYFTILGIFLALIIIEIIFGLELPSSAYVGAFAGLSIMVNTIYMQHTIKLLANSTNDQQERIHVLKKYGGTSIMLAITYTILLIAGIFITVIGTEMLVENIIF